MKKTIKEFLINEMLDRGVLSPEQIEELSANNEQLLSLASKVDKIDPRMPGKITFTACHLMLVALMGVFAGAQTWRQIAEYGKAKIELVRKYLPYVTESPSPDTLRRFFMIVKPSELESVYREWAMSFQRKITVASSNERDDSGIWRHIAIDGKTMHGASDPEKLYQEYKEEISREYAETAKLHMVSAYNASEGISLAQERVAVKKNELDAIPKLLDVIDLGEGDIVTIDAMGTHTNIAEKIVNSKADYLFEVKDNQKKLKEYISLCMDTFLERRERTKLYSVAEETLYDHSQTTHRECFVFMNDPMMKRYAKIWPGFSTFGVIKTTRTRKNGESVSEDHYFITSLPRDPALIMKHKREHWQVENALHWNLDIIFNEDRGRKMMNSAQNFSLLTKMALAILKKDKRKMPMTSKRLLAGWNDNFMESLIDQFVSFFE